jgi:hypothetical protein
MYAMNQAKQAEGFPGAMLGSYPSPPTPYSGEIAAGRAPELPMALERLERAIACVTELASALDNRLTGPVARPQAPINQQTSAPKAVMSTGMGNSLDTATDRLQSVTAQLTGLLDRLEF